MTILIYQKPFQGQFLGSCFPFFFYFLKVSDELLNNDSIVRSPFVLNKACLAGKNDLEKEEFDSMDSDFYDQLVEGIT